MSRVLALAAILALGVGSSAAFAAGNCGGSYHVSTSKTTVASAAGQSSTPSTPIVRPRTDG